jgi:hypothetical protein
MLVEDQPSKPVLQPQASRDDGESVAVVPGCAFVVLRVVPGCAFVVLAVVPDCAFVVLGVVPGCAFVVLAAVPDCAFVVLDCAWHLAISSGVVVAPAAHPFVLEDQPVPTLQRQASTVCAWHHVTSSGFVVASGVHVFVVEDHPSTPTVQPQASRPAIALAVSAEEIGKASFWCEDLD